MKALFTAYSLSRQNGGIFTIMRCLARSLGDAGVTVAAAGVADEFSAEDASLWGGVSPTFCPSVGPRSLGYAPSLPGALKASSAEVVHVHGLWTYVSLASHRHCRKFRLPYVVSPHGMLDAWALRHSGWKKRIALGLYEKAHLAEAPCLHAYCHAELKSIRAAGLHNPVCIIPNGIDLPPAGVVPRSEFRVPSLEGRKMLLYLGRLHPKKNLLSLICAWADVQRNSSSAHEWVLAIAGWDQGGYELELKNQCSALRVNHSVVFLGPLFGETKDACYAQCDAFVLPSLSEGLPMVVLEAWAHAKPVLITPQCNLPMGYQRGAALSIDSTPASLTLGLGTLFAMSEAERLEMGNKGRTLVEEQYTWPKVAADFASVYAWLTGSGPKPHRLIAE